jgi:hypothetical protein
MKDLEGITFELDEAAFHLRELAEEFRSGKLGEDDDPALEVMLGHVLDHLCRAWNARELDADEKMALSQDEFERMSNSVPNFQLNRKLQIGTYGDA